MLSSSGKILRELLGQRQRQQGSRLLLGLLMLGLLCTRASVRSGSVQRYSG